MACSKIFSGDLPEITNDIIQYLRNDLKSLYSCILVNRLLCQIATPILWKDPFSVICQDGYPYNFLDTYFSFFNENDKTKLKEFGITINSPSLKKPLFNYPSFIKTLDPFRVKLHTVNWINNLDTLTYSTNLDKSNKITFPKYENQRLIIEKNLLNSIGTRDFICISLIKLFMNNNVSLNNLNIIIDGEYSGFLFEIFELILNNSKFMSDIENFTLKFYDVYKEPPKYDQIFLTPLPLSLIKHLDIHIKIERHLGNSIDGKIERYIADLIQQQNQLLSLTLYSITSNVLDTLKYHSNTLTSVRFDSCDFTNILSFDGFKHLTQLKSLQLIWCAGLTTRFFQSLLDLPAPLKIKSLKVVGQTSGITLLFQKIGFYLEHLQLEIYKYAEREKAFESIINNCDKIQFLYLSEIGYKIIPQLFKLIAHLDKHLRYLSIQYKYY